MENQTANDTIAAAPFSLGVQILLGIILYFMTGFAMCGNMLVIVSVCAFRQLRTITNYFIISLATADLLLTILVLPFNAIFTITGHWPFGFFFCDLYISVDILACTASILNLCVIALDRYWAITSPFTYYQRVTATSSFILIGCVWVVSFLISVLPVLLNLHEDDFLRENNWYDDPSFCVLGVNGIFAVVSSIISFYIPAGVIFFVYFRIFRVARRQARQIASHNNAAQRFQDNRKGKPSMARERKAAKTLGVIMGVFIACWLPFFTVNVIDPFCGRCIPATVFNTFVWLGYINSCANPLIYAQNPSFRNAFKGLLCCHKCRGIKYRSGESSDDNATVIQQRRLANTSQVRTVSSSVMKSQVEYK
ncbi:putative D(1) dopamine receptor-like [Apostichopus japonicus]|uniref:Putative D(1) dopamine receptor-like n=1 Tax=Stichopus japonicus TaxID=307972 RepID=A0A2G8K4C3_STIJA|nr:putative D(1) dopamine receptor-like [Apostichopus japonicus]